MLYFSYGSNMSSRRLLARAPSARKLGMAKLYGHALRFHKISHKDGTAKCNAFETGSPQNMVIGIVYSVSEEDRDRLDQYEGAGNGYEIKKIQVEMQDRTVVEAFTYYATHIDPDLKPLLWYKQHVLYGAIENNLPAEYIRQINNIESIDDPDSARHDIEISIYM